MLPADEWPIVELFDILEIIVIAEYLDLRLSKISISFPRPNVVDPPHVIPAWIISNCMTDAPFAKYDKVLEAVFVAIQKIRLYFGLDVIVESTQRSW